MARLIASEMQSRKAASAKGGANAKIKKDQAGEWQKRIEPMVRRYIAAGKTNQNIGVLLKTRAGKSEDTVARFAARIRKPPHRK